MDGGAQGTDGECTSTRETPVQALATDELITGSHAPPESMTVTLRRGIFGSMKKKSFPLSRVYPLRESGKADFRVAGMTLKIPSKVK